MKLTSLDCGMSQVSDLSPLEGMPLTNLVCGVTPVSDLSPLRGMPLVKLNVSDCKQFVDLSPLAGLPLTKLDCYSTRVSDLSPLKGMPLTSLSCRATFISDLSPLEGMSLTECGFSPRKITKGMEVLRGMTSLKRFIISSKPDGKLPAEDFWKKYDAGEFAQPPASGEQPEEGAWNTPEFQMWVIDTQSLRAEQQVDAVSKKLMELNPGFRW
jgi:Leucine-rich repeat (LRR) protein